MLLGELRDRTTASGAFYRRGQKRTLVSERLGSEAYVTSISYSASLNLISALENEGNLLLYEG